MTSKSKSSKIKKSSTSKKTKKSFKKKISKPRGGMKLEERIAPGMLGTGVVDTGLADTAQDISSAEDNSSISQEARHTSTSSSDINSSPTDSSGNYTDTDTSTTASDLDHASSASHATTTMDYTGLDSHEAAATATPAWQQPEWVNVASDGSIHVELPEGVSVEDGVATFEADAAASALPEGVQLSVTSGAAFIVLPPHGVIDVEASTVTIPGDHPLAQAIPGSLPIHENPDESVTVTLPSEGVSFDTENNTLTIDNEVVNQLAPESMTIHEDGSVSVELPPNTTVNEDGTLDLDPEQAAQISDPIPTVFHEADWAEVQADGSVVITPPEEVTLSEEDRTAAIPIDVANEILPLPDHVSLNDNGTMTITLPENTQYDPTSNTITFAQDLSSGLTLENIPQGFDAHLNPDNTISVTLPDGANYSTANGNVTLDNYLTNQALPNHLSVTSGAAFILFPPHFNFSHGTLTLSPSDAHAMISPPPEVVLSGPEYIESTPQGDVLVNANDSLEVNAEEKIITLNSDTIQQDFPGLLPKNVTLTSEGTLEVALPEGTQYDSDANTLTVPAGTLNMAQVPEGVSCTRNDDGTLSIDLPGGVTFDEHQNTVTLDNYWTNEALPAPVEVSPVGEVTVTLPAETLIQDDGTVIVPSDHADFLENPDPEYVVHGPDYVEAQPDGAISITPPEGVEIQADLGIATLSAETLNADFGDLLPLQASLTSEGTLEIPLPESASFDESTRILSVSTENVNLLQIPDSIAATENTDGTLSITIPDGVTIDSGSVILDNYWTNEVLPENISVNTEGQVSVDLPVNTQYFDDSGITIPANSADFISNPDPTYVTQGPDWISPNSDGSVTLNIPEQVSVDAEAATITMDVQTAQEQFAAVIPEGVTLNSNGSITIDVPSNVEHDPVENTLTFPKGEIHVNEIPPVAEPTLNSDGSITATLPEGAVFNADNHTVVVEPQMIEHILPPTVELSETGQVTVSLPTESQIITDSNGVITNVTIPTGSTDVLASAPPVIASAPAIESTDAEDVLTNSDLSRWDKIEAKVDRWLDKWEAQANHPNKFPENLDERWHKLETQAEKWMEQNTGKLGLTQVAAEWNQLDDRADKLMEKWESALEDRIENRFDSHESHAQKLLESWEKQIDRWEDRLENGHHGKGFDNQLAHRLKEMESRWDRLDSKVDKWVDKWSSKHDLAENKDDWNKLDKQAESLFAKIRTLQARS